MQKPRIDPADAHKTLLIIWFALLMSQLVFFVLIYVVKPELIAFDFTKPLLGDEAFIIGGSALIAIHNLIISLVQRKKFLEQSVREQNVAHVQTALIVGCALSESISLFGLFLAFAFDYSYFWMFLALGVVGTVLHFPSRKNVDAASYKKV